MTRLGRRRSACNQRHCSEAAGGGSEAGDVTKLWRWLSMLKVLMGAMRPSTMVM